MQGPKLYRRKGRRRWIVVWPELRGSKLARRSREFADEGVARAKLAELERLFPAVGAAGLAMAADQRDEYWSAKRLLPEGVSLVDVAREWAARHPAGAELEVAPLMEEWLLYKERRDGSARTGKDRRNRLRAFVEGAGVVHVGDIDAERLERHLWRRKEDGGLIARQTALADASVARDFCRWLVRVKRALPANPLDLVDMAPVDSRSPAILGAAEARALLEAALARPQQRQMAPFYAIAAFAGLRPSEIERLREADLAGGYIRVRKIKRGRGLRLVPIEPNLAAWLEARPPVWPLRYRQNLARKVRADAGVLSIWQDDILRHSYISARLARGDGEDEVAAAAGNSPRVIHTHYRALMTPAEGDAWFRVMPQKNRA